MFAKRSKIVAVVLLAGGFAAVGAAFWDSPRKPAADESMLSRNKALSRLNLRKLGWAMHRYANANKSFLPPPALLDKDGKPLLSWRVLLLPYLGERKLYEQFKLTEAWDSPHNKNLLHKMPKVFAPPGVKSAQPFTTFYQVFVSPKPKRAEGEIHMTAAFVQGEQMRYPASFPDGVANTILIVEAEEAVPWTKPADIQFPLLKTEDITSGKLKLLPELGGLFPDVVHAVYADGKVHTLTKKRDDRIMFTLRAAIVRDDGMAVNYEVLEARYAASADERQKNRQLQENLEFEQERLRLLREELDALKKQSSPKKAQPDTQEEELKKENARLQQELEQAKQKLQKLNREILQEPSAKSPISEQNKSKSR